ncbi:hypothetical protein HY213_02235 [Candidatus Peregrinibacteria bacterium]|nr:hypothetical protein [Candidatus Peregrinibacteria bacterium]
MSTTHFSPSAAQNALPPRMQPKRSQKRGALEELPDLEELEEPVEPAEEELLEAEEDDPPDADERREELLPAHAHTSHV